MVFIHKSVSTDRSFGADLLALRELRGWTREQLAKATGIHTSSIAMLEEERFGELSDPVYAERHVRVLVKALEGRVGFFLGKYREAVAQTGLAEQAIANTSFIRRLRRSDFFVTSRYAAAAVLLPFVALIGWYVWRQTLILTAPPPLEVSMPAPDATVRESFVDIKGRTDPSAAVTVNGIAAVVERDGSFDYSFDVPRGLTRLVIQAKRRYGGLTESIRYVTYQAATATSTTSTTP